MKKTMKVAQLCLAAVALAATAQVANAGRPGGGGSVVACVGDSITAGYNLAGNQSYPSQLGGMLGSGYTVTNWGVSSTTLLYNGNYPYNSTRTYSTSLRSNPNYVIIAFGTNDTKSYNWDAHSAEFIPNYEDFISKYTSLSTHPRAFICKIPPYYLPNPWPSDFPDPTRITTEILPTIATIASATGSGIIDNNTQLQNHPELFTDGIHPTVDGANILAINAYNAITGAGVALLSGSTISDGGGSAGSAFDNNSSTYYDSTLATGAWVGVDLGNGNTKKVSLICYSPRYSGFEGRMVGGVFQGSNDQVTWASLAPAITSSPGDTYSSIAVTGAPAYRYLRYYSAGASSFGDVGEIKFFGK